MNSKVISFIKNFSYTLSSNLIALIVSTLIILIVPKLIGVKEYGYFQLYLFYSSYVGFMHFGWNDGIYLRFGGKEYKDLNKNLFFSQFIMLFLMQLVITIVIFVITAFLVTDNDKGFIFKMIGICSIISNMRLMILMILQSTNRIKEYAQITIIDRLLYCCLVLLLLILGVRQYKLLIVADLLGRFVSLIYSIYCCKDIVFSNFSMFIFDFKEIIENMSVGIKLMFANIASMLIIGIVRFGIERTWDVSTFGKVSLTLSVSNLMMLFINAVGLIMFPILRRTSKEKFVSIYITMRDFMMILLLGILILYYPLKTVLSEWLPRYADSLKYMALIFPICVYEGKMALLINTYLKTLRKEKIMLKVNLVALSLSFCITIVSTIIFKNLNFAVVSIVIVLAFRCLLAETSLFKVLNIYSYKNIILEVLMTVVFMLTGWFVNSWISMILYFIAYLVYLFIKSKDIITTISNLKSFIRA